MNTFEIVKKVISTRRNVKPALMNGRKIDDTTIYQLLELANWAPSHGLTEPWRFIVYSENALQQFCKDHAEMYRSVTPPEKFNQGKYENMQHVADTVSHLIVAYMKRTPNTKFPVLEEIAAVSAAIQNILLGAHAVGIAPMWSTGGLTHHEKMKEYLALQPEDVVMGLIYLGYTDQPVKEGKRNTSIEEKITWKQ